MKKVFIFGGSFDPVHTGHAAFIQSILPHADELRIVPSGEHPEGKKYFFGPKERVLLLKAALGMLGAPDLENLGLSSEEKAQILSQPLLSDKIIIREDELYHPFTAYTVDLIRAFRKEDAASAYCLAVGADQAEKFLKWKEAEALLSMVSVWTVPRDGSTPQTGIAWNMLPFEKTPASSSEARHRLHQGLPLGGLLPPAAALLAPKLPRACR